MDQPWTTVLAVFGVGSIVAAVIARGVAIAQLRQAWINALRDDLAEVLTGFDRVSLAIRRLKTADDIAEASELRHRTMAAYRRVLLRLNLVEPLHADLKNKLDSMLQVASREVHLALIEEATTTAQALLKREWQVTKFGPFVDAVSWLKKEI